LAEADRSGPVQDIVSRCLTAQIHGCQRLTRYLIESPGAAKGHHQR
jgi:hypothetical protein